MFSHSGKRLLRNVIRHTDTHNRLIEEDEMWRQKRGDRGGDHDGRHSNHDNHRGNRGDVYDDRAEDFRNSRVRSSCQKVPRAHMDREEETRPHSYGDREPENKSTFFMRQLAKAEDNDPDRWGHNGFKEMYPQDFRSDRSLSEESQGRYQPVKPRRKKVKKYHQKSAKKKAKHKKSRKKDSVSEKDEKQRKRSRNGRSEKKAEKKYRPHKTRTEVWVENTREITKRGAYESDDRMVNSVMSVVSVKRNLGIGDNPEHFENTTRRVNKLKRDISSSSELEAGQLPSRKRSKPHRTYRRKDRSYSSSDSDSESNSQSDKFSSSIERVGKRRNKSSRYRQQKRRKRHDQTSSSSSLSSPTSSSSGNSSR